MLRVRFRYWVRVGFVVSVMVNSFGTFSRLILCAQHLQTVKSVFYHLGGVDAFHHDSPAFSVSSHLWVDAKDAHAPFQSVKPSHVWTSSGSCSRHRHTQRASCYVGVFPSHHMPIP